MHYGEIKQKLLEKEGSSMVINLREEAALIYEPCGRGFWVHSFWMFFPPHPYNYATEGWSLVWSLLGKDWHDLTGNHSQRLSFACWSNHMKSMACAVKSTHSVNDRKHEKVKIVQNATVWPEKGVGLFCLNGNIKLHIIP